MKKTTPRAKEILEFMRGTHEKNPVCYVCKKKIYRTLPVAIGDDKDSKMMYRHRPCAPGTDKYFKHFPDSSLRRHYAKVQIRNQNTGEIHKQTGEYHECDEDVPAGGLQDRHAN